MYDQKKIGQKNTVAKKMLIKTRFKTLSNIYNVTEIKTCMRAVGYASKVNMTKPDKESIRRKDDGI